MFQAKIIEKVKSRPVCSTIFIPKNFAFIRQCENRGPIIRRMRIACLIPKTTNTHSEYVIHTASPLQKW